MILQFSQNLKRYIFKSLPGPLQEQVASGFVKFKKRKIKKLITPTALIFFITSRCNARCTHCFYWRELNQTPDELTLDEIEKIASTLLYPVNLSLTGGEPFLRKDIKKICEIFHNKNGCNDIGIATNGFLTDRVVSTCESILKSNLLRSFSVQVSLDGLKNTHDEIRGVKGGFDKAIKTIEILSDMAKRFPCFSVNVSMTIQKKNFTEIEELIKFLLPFEISIKFALIRGQNFGTYGLPLNISNEIDPKDDESPIIELDALKKLFDKIKKINNSSKYSFWSERQQKKIELSLNMMETRKRQIVCYAGKIDGVLYSNGDIALCELIQPLGNIKNYNYSFVDLWNSDDAEKHRQKIKNCFCIHGCNLTTSLMLNPKIVAATLRRL